MVILGLGSNVGDRMMYLRLALKKLRELSVIRVKQVSPVYVSDALLPENAPDEWNQPFLNAAVHIETDLKPRELLQYTKKIEAEIGVEEKPHWGPRPIDVDILAWDDLVYRDEKLEIPHAHLEKRPFALWPLADLAPRWVNPLADAFHGKTAAEIVEAWGSRFSGEAPLHTRQIFQRIDAPVWVGILNVTPDSFSDGNLFLQEEAALKQAEHLVSSGAEIIDMGAEATNPKASNITEDIEWQRLEKVLHRLLSDRKNFLIPPKISLDTRNVSVAEKALKLGVDWINDVSGLEDPAMRDLLKNQQCDVVFMHHLGIPSSEAAVLPRNQNPSLQVYDWLARKIEALEKQGFSRERLIADVGIGFGKSHDQSLALLQDIDLFNTLGVRRLVGHSRKRFLQLFTPEAFEGRDPETQTLSLYLAEKSIDYLRVHNVLENARNLSLLKSLNNRGQP